MAKKIGLSYFRKRIMDDDNVKFIYSSKSEVIHDKSCDRAASIPDENLIYLEEYHPEMNQCPHCAVKAYIRMGAGDFGNHGVYGKLFERMHAETQVLRHMYVELGMRTKVYPNGLLVRDREDVWKIEALDNRGNVVLLHNNYHIQKNGERKFVRGFHVQNEYCSRTSLQNAVRTIETYSYDKHRESAMSKREGMYESEPVAIEETLTEKKGIAGRFRAIREWFAGRKDVFKSKSKAESNDKTDFRVEISNFNVVDDVGYPQNGDRCIYIWEDRNGGKRWQTGVYDMRKGCFFIRFNDINCITVDKKVLAWKRLSDEVFSVSVENAAVTGGRLNSKNSRRGI